MVGRTIGELARDTGVNVKTIRYYQGRGLIERSLRPTRGRRRYGEEVRRYVAANPTLAVSRAPRIQTSGPPLCVSESLPNPR